MLKGNFFIDAPHGRLEALYRPENHEAERVALVLHPHPLYSGTMHNKVVYRTAKALQDSGYETLRINFRGVGASTGSFGDGIGELEDARIALDFLLSDQPRAREVVVAGFSFGSVVGLRLGCADPRVDWILAIGMPARYSNLGFLDSCTKRKFFLHGELDDIAPLGPLKDLLSRLPADGGNRLETIAGAGHFFDDHGQELMAMVGRSVGWGRTAEGA